jgi:hypothetical protein
MIDGVGIVGMALLDLAKFLGRGVIVHVVEVVKRTGVQWIGGPECKFLIRFGRGLLSPRKFNAKARNQYDGQAQTHCDGRKQGFRRSRKLTC